LTQEGSNQKEDYDIQKNVQQEKSSQIVTNQFTVGEETFNILKTVIKDSLKDVNENLVKLTTVVIDLATIIKSIEMNIKKYDEYKKNDIKHNEQIDNVSKKESQTYIEKGYTEGIVPIYSSLVNENLNLQSNEVDKQD